eukprot:4624797-Pyramimonas_sp.AAC.1
MFLRGEGLGVARSGPGPGCPWPFAPSWSSRSPLGLDRQGCSGGLGGLDRHWRCAARGPSADP